MSVRARDVLAAIDLAVGLERRNPRLFWEQARRDRDCRQLRLALERYRVQRQTVGGRQDRLEEEPPDASWLEERARRREERHLKRRQEFDVARREKRARLSSLALHRLALQREARISTVGAGNIAASAAGSGHPSKNLASDRSAAQTLEDDPRWREHWSVIRSRLERAHELLDEAEGLGTVAATSQMLGAEKDRRILGEVGLSPLAVVEKLGRDIAGSPETVRRVRRAAGRSAKDGTLVDRPEPGSGVRRVVISDE